MTDLYNYETYATASGATDASSLSEIIHSAERLNELVKGLVSGTSQISEGATGLPAVSITDSATEPATSPDATGLSELIADYEIDKIAQQIKRDGSLGNNYVRHQIQAIFNSALTGGSESVEALVDAINKELEGTGYKLSGNVVTESKMVTELPGVSAIVPKSARADVSSLQVSLTSNGCSIEDQMQVGYHIHPPYDGPDWRLLEPAYEVEKRMPYSSRTEHHLPPPPSPAQSETSSQTQ